MMKKWKRALLAGLAACAALTVTASASNFDSTADTLKAMGLFAGTGAGYELDRAPTRAEAATMLVRLLGKAEEAESQWAAGSGSFAFRDMENYTWAKPYVHWLSQQGLAAGTSKTQFSPSAPCTAQMYAAFLMRALGYYESKGDFAFADAVPFAREHGVLNDANCDTAAFLRDHVVAASYTALSAKPKTGGDDLLSKLVEEGAVDASAASAERQKFALYRSYAGTVGQTADGAALENVTSLSVSGGLSLEVAAVSKTRIGGGKMSSESTLTMTVPGEDPFVLERTGYFADGRLYTEENGVKSTETAALDTVLNGLSQPEAVPLVLLSELRATSTGYQLVYSEAGRQEYLSQLWVLESALGGSALGLKGLTIGELTAEIRAERGKLSSLSSGVTLTGTMNNLSTGAPVEVTVRAQQNSKVTETGDKVTVTAPRDLASYPAS
ncbi:MAG: S-layer homology domain-containing protein [Clostridiaceae bacterium]|nr:S-layer homology domain-containing protein [Clostridiaceae bacterium]